MNLVRAYKPAKRVLTSPNIISKDVLEIRGKSEKFMKYSKMLDQNLRLWRLRSASGLGSAPDLEVVELLRGGNLKSTLSPRVLGVGRATGT